MLRVPVRAKKNHLHSSAASATDLAAVLRVGGVRRRGRDSLAAVDDDVLRPDAALQHAHLGVVSAATEQTRGLDAEVGDALAVVVHDAEAVLLQRALVVLFDFLSAETDQREKLDLTASSCRVRGISGGRGLDALPAVFPNQPEHTSYVSVTVNRKIKATLVTC